MTPTYSGIHQLTNEGAFDHFMKFMLNQYCTVVEQTQRLSPHDARYRSLEWKFSTPDGLTVEAVLDIAPGVIDTIRWRTDDDDMGTVLRLAL